ncbi:hypothetical protein [Legionella fallonii]|uniref:hypothetical protein n=1 Tax=Legionella fallonii TaxID=96230 RepID=UPI0012ED7E3F|nr:hypothetical protein [Legionella fallonii]
MNRLAMIAATCILGLALAACGENNTPKPAADKTGTTTPAPTPAKTDNTQHH